MHLAWLSKRFHVRDTLHTRYIYFTLSGKQEYRISFIRNDNKKRRQNISW
jgi:hypothetical protein